VFIVRAMEVNDEIKNKNISTLPLEGARFVVCFIITHYRKGRK